MKRALCRLLVAALGLLAACAEPPPVATPPPPVATPAPLAVGELLANPPSAAQLEQVVGYLYADADGAVLIDGLSFSAAPHPSPLEADPARQIWLDSHSDATVVPLSGGDASVAYSLVQVQGRLDGPGRFGPNGRHRYQIAMARITPLIPLEPTIATLLANSSSYENRLIRVGGDLLAGDREALLIEQLQPGGVPAEGSRQIKLTAPLRDQALLEHLDRSSSGGVYFGPVAVEGLWRRGGLLPLAVHLREPVQ